MKAVSNLKHFNFFDNVQADITRHLEQMYIKIKDKINRRANS